MILRGGHGGPQATAPLVKNKLWKILTDEMLTYALALLNQVFLAHKHVRNILDLF